MDIRSWTFVIVGITFAVYIGIAIYTRVASTKGFYVAGQGVPAIFNGMATGADWMSAASFISMAGMISFMGYTGTMYLIGWTGGYVLLALLLAPYLRKFGKFTVPDFVGDRYYSKAARLVAILCAIFISFTYVAGQMRGVGVVFSRFLEVPINTGVVIGMVLVFTYATLGGMKGITWTQVAQYVVLIIAYLVPAIAISLQMTGNPIPLPARCHRQDPHRPRPAGIHGHVRRRQEEHDRRLRDHDGADGRYRRPAARDHPVLHGEDRGRRALERVLGALVHRPALHHRPGHRHVRAGEHDPDAAQSALRRRPRVVPQLAEDRLDRLGGQEW
jgi:Na+(H+)/acetate symporter ActP